MGCFKSKPEDAGKPYKEAPEPEAAEKTTAPAQQTIGAPASIAPPAAQSVAEDSGQQKPSSAASRQRQAEVASSTASKQKKNGKRVEEPAGGATESDYDSAPEPPLLTNASGGGSRGISGANKALAARLEAAEKNKEVPVLFPEVWLMTTKEDGAETFERKPISAVQQPAATGPTAPVEKEVRAAPKAGAKRKANSASTAAPRPADGRRVEPLTSQQAAGNRGSSEARGGPQEATRYTPLDASEQELLSDVADTRIQLHELDEDLDFAEVAGRRGGSSGALGFR